MSRFGGGGGISGFFGDDSSTGVLDCGVSEDSLAAEVDSEDFVDDDSEEDCDGLEDDESARSLSGG